MAVKPACAKGFLLDTRLPLQGACTEEIGHYIHFRGPEYQKAQIRGGKNDSEDQDERELRRVIDSYGRSQVASIGTYISDSHVTERYQDREYE